MSSPVPRDIEVSQSLEGSLAHISKVAEDCGILESELEPYGRFKAKVSWLPLMQEIRQYFRSFMCWTSWVQHFCAQHRNSRCVLGVLEISKRLDSMG